ncbi:MAG: YggT family protein [Acidimicrobiales bacterium]
MVIVCYLILFYIIAVFARIILSWFPLDPDGPIATVAGFLYMVTDPVLTPLRRMIPPIRMGGMGLDLSPTIVLFGLFFLQAVIC